MKKGMYSVHLSLFSLDVFIVIDVNRNMHSSYVSCLHLLYSFLTSGLVNACSIKWLLIIFFLNLVPLAYFAAMPKRVENARIACLDFSLQKAKMHLGVSVVVEDPAQLEAIRQR